jgi:hypothetical protein
MRFLKAQNELCFIHNDTNDIRLVFHDTFIISHEFYLY